MLNTECDHLHPRLGFYPITQAGVALDSVRPSSKNGPVESLLASVVVDRPGMRADDSHTFQLVIGPVAKLRCLMAAVLDQRGSSLDLTMLRLLTSYLDSHSRSYPNKC